MFWIVWLKLRANVHAKAPASPKVWTCNTASSKNSPLSMSTPANSVLTRKPASIKGAMVDQYVCAFTKSYSEFTVGMCKLYKDAGVMVSSSGGGNALRSDVLTVIKSRSDEKGGSS